MESVYVNQLLPSTECVLISVVYGAFNKESEKSNQNWEIRTSLTIDEFVQLHCSSTTLKLNKNNHKWSSNWKTKINACM